MEKHNVKKWLEEQEISTHSDDERWAFQEKQGKRQEEALKLVLPALRVLLRQIDLDDEYLNISNEGVFDIDACCEAVSIIIKEDETEDPLGFEAGIWTGEDKKDISLKDVENAGAIYYYFWHPEGDKTVGESFDLQECFNKFLEYWKEINHE